MSRPTFEVALRRLPNETRLVLQGELDMHGDKPLREAVAALPPPDGTRLVLDLGELGFMDSSGVRLVLEHRAELDASGWPVAVRLGDGEPRRIFALLGLERLESETVPAPLRWRMGGGRAR
jgi:anti-anti-sigma factor